MKLTVLGSSAAYPTPDNPASGYLLQATIAGVERSVQIDAGTGTLAALGRHLDFARLDGLVLSHTHADHCLDVYPLYYARRFHPDDLPRLPLICPEGSVDILAPIARADGPEERGKLEKVFEIRELPVRPPSQTEQADQADQAEAPDAELVEDVAGFRFRFTPTDHPVPTLAMRMQVDDAAETDGARSFAFTADTGPGVDLVPFARGVDLLVAEATYQSDTPVDQPTHLTAAQAGELARRAGVGRLVLTHVWPTFDPERSLAEAREAAGTDITVELARPGRVFEI